MFVLRPLLGQPMGLSNPHECCTAFSWRNCAGDTGNIQTLKVWSWLCGIPPDPSRCGSMALGGTCCPWHRLSTFQIPQGDREWNCTRPPVPDLACRIAQSRYLWGYIPGVSIRRGTTQDLKIPRICHGMLSQAHLPGPKSPFLCPKRTRNLLGSENHPPVPARALLYDCRLLKLPTGIQSCLLILGCLACSSVMGVL